MSFWQSAGGASAISAGASILSSAFGGDGAEKRAARRGWQNAIKYQPELLASNIQGIVGGARRAGIHPLLALGASPGGGGMPGPVGMAGQSDSKESRAASAISEHFERVASMRAQTELTEAQAELSRARTMEHQFSNDTRGALFGHLDQKAKWRRHPIRLDSGGAPLDQDQVSRPGEVQAFNPSEPTENKDVISPMSTVRLGSQTIKVPFSDMESFLDNPVKAAGLTYLYHGNKNVDWVKAAKEYAQGAKITAVDERAKKYMAEYRNRKKNRPKVPAISRKNSKYFKLLGQGAQRNTERLKRKYHKRNWRQFMRR